MSRVDTVLNNLEGNVQDFKFACDIPALSPDIEDEIAKAVAQGVQLRDNIQEVLDNLTDVQMRLARTADEEDQVPIMEVCTPVSREALEKHKDALRKLNQCTPEETLDRRWIGFGTGSQR